MEIYLLELVDDAFSIEEETCWLKFKTNEGKFIAFWGEPNTPNRNIVSLRHQPLPLMLSIDDLDLADCNPSDWERSEYALMLSVPSYVAIEINPEI